MLCEERAIKASFGGLAAQAHYGYIVGKIIHREKLSNIFESGWVISSSKKCRMNPGDNLDRGWK